MAYPSKTIIAHLSSRDLPPITTLSIVPAAYNYRYRYEPILFTVIGYKNINNISSSDS